MDESLKRTTHPPPNLPQRTYYLFISCVWGATEILTPPEFHLFRPHYTRYRVKEHLRGTEAETGELAKAGIKPIVLFWLRVSGSVSLSTVDSIRVRLRASSPVFGQLGISALAYFRGVCYSPFNMDVSEMARLGAIATNKILTKESRAKAAKKGWKNRHKKLKSAK